MAITAKPPSDPEVRPLMFVDDVDSACPAPAVGAASPSSPGPTSEPATCPLPDRQNPLLVDHHPDHHHLDNHSHHHRRPVQPQSPECRDPSPAVHLGPDACDGLGLGRRSVAGPGHRSLPIRSRCSRIVDNLNGRHVFAGLSLLHTLVILLELTMASILIRRFNSSYAARPVLTTMVANALLAGIADSLAQTISITQSWRESRNLAGLTSDRPGIELRDMEKRDVKTTVATGAAGPVEVTSSPARFDPDRLARFVFYGFAFAPVQYKWFAFLSRTFPLVPTLSPAKSFVPVLKRVALDQTVLAPLGLALFYTYMTLAEGRGTRALSAKFRDVYVPTLKANYVLWPMVQLINFRLIPMPLQLPFVSTIGIGWTAFLSLTNAAPPAEPNREIAV